MHLLVAYDNYIPVYIVLRRPAINAYSEIDLMSSRHGMNRELYPSDDRDVKVSTILWT